MNNIVLLKCILNEQNEFYVYVVDKNYKNIPCIISKNLRVNNRFYIIQQSQLEHKYSHRQTEFYYINGTVEILPDYFDIGEKIISCNELYDIVVNKKIINGIDLIMLEDICSSVCSGDELLKYLIYLFKLFV